MTLLMEHACRTSTAYNATPPFIGDQGRDRTPLLHAQAIKHCMHRMVLVTGSHQVVQIRLDVHYAHNPDLRRCEKSQIRAGGFIGFKYATFMGLTQRQRAHVMACQSLRLEPAQLPLSCPEPSCMDQNGYKSHPLPPFAFRACTATVTPLHLCTGTSCRQACSDEQLPGQSRQLAQKLPVRRASVLLCQLKAMLHYGPRPAHDPVSACVCDQPLGLGALWVRGRKGGYRAPPPLWTQRRARWMLDQHLSALTREG